MPKCFIFPKVSKQDPPWCMDQVEIPATLDSVSSEFSIPDLLRKADCIASLLSQQGKQQETLQDHQSKEAEGQEEDFGQEGHSERKTFEAQ